MSDDNTKEVAHRKACQCFKCLPIPAPPIPPASMTFALTDEGIRQAVIEEERRYREKGREATERANEKAAAEPRYNQDPTKGGIKTDGDKVRVELLPLDAVREIAKVLTFGAKKYSDDNWLEGMSWRRVLGSCLRHLMDWSIGEDKDPETGISHLAHAGCNILFLITYELRRLGEDDRAVNQENFKGDSA